MFNFYDFIQVFVFTINYHLKSAGNFKLNRNNFLVIHHAGKSSFLQADPYICLLLLYSVYDRVYLKTVK